ncbi:MAG: HEAT repeat domain-containing protein [Chitinispirillia bacterium]|jgi:HEAT repeat protein
MNRELVYDNLNSNNTNEVCSALEILRNEGTLSDIQVILPLLKKKNISVMKAAVNAACNIIRERLVTHFNELEPDVRKKLSTLMESLDPAIINEISKDIFSEDKNRRLRAVQILGLLKKNPQIHFILAKLIKDGDEKIRATAITLLGKMVDPKDNKTILSLLSDKDKRVRANTIEALENLGDKKLVPILIRFKSDQNNRIRGNVLKALFFLGYTDIESDLMSMLESGNEFMIASALWVITKTRFSTPKILDATGYCLLATNKMVTDNARKALKSQNTSRSLGYLRYLDNL